jgi:L-threonylcarbamoyladenylate synthase
MNTRIAPVSPTHPDGIPIAEAAQLIRQGELVAMPTETVYGLAGDALNPAAVQAIFVAKGRPSSDPLIVHIADLDQLAMIARDIPSSFQLLADTFWPGPLTIILPKHPTLDSCITAGHDTVAVRMPNHPVARALIRQSGHPLVAPSANLFSHPSPTTAAHVFDDLQGRIPLILDAGPCEIGVESTIIDITQTPPVILRHGGIPAEQLTTMLGDIIVRQRIIAHNQAAPAPGMLLKHYSPRTPLVIYRGSHTAVHAAILTQPRETTLWVCYDEDIVQAQALRIAYLSLGPRHESSTIARNLFATLRSADLAGKALLVIAEPLGDGVAAAVRDRLFRAAEGHVITLSDA